MPSNYNQSGVVLLYAVLMVSIVLTISLSLLNISFKQIILSAVGQESQRAHFFAGGALDCATFINSSNRTPDGLDDTSNNPFGIIKTSVSPPAIQTTAINIFTCGVGADLINATAIVGTPPGIPPNAITDTGSVKYIFSRYHLSNVGNTSCATVEVAKVESGDYANFGEGSGVLDPGRTFITALGYNTCDINSPRRVERAAKTRI